MGVQENRSPMFCPGCMTQMQHPSRCANTVCRWDETKQPEIQEHLPRHYMLFDRYYIGRVLGQGGFGITYLALDTELDRQLAIKEYLPRDHCSRLTDRVTVRSHGGDKAELFSNGLQGFLNEAKNIARLDGHPNIVSITDHVKGNGTAYMVMQFVHGKTLKQHLTDKGGRIPYTVARDIMLHVMSGLRKAHQHGVLHRDISPDNIMVSSNGPVKIIDFGAARQASGELARGLTVILKPGYAPEEQYRSRGKQGPWTDIYAVAATLYRCITGETPPDAPDRLAEDELINPRAFCPDLPPKVEAVIIKALAVKAVDRYQTIDEFQEALLNAAGLKQKKVEEKLPEELPEAPKQRAKVEEKPAERPRAREQERPQEKPQEVLYDKAKEKKIPTRSPDRSPQEGFEEPPPRPWFLSPLMLAVFGVLLLAAAGLGFYLHTSTPSPAAAGTSVPPVLPAEAPPAVNRDWRSVSYNDPALSTCGNVQPCLDRKTKADTLLAEKNWKEIRFDSPLLADCMRLESCVERGRQSEKLKAVTDWNKVQRGPMLDDCMGYGPCLKRAAALARGPYLSDEELGNYSYCKESPNPPRCLAYKKSEGIKDGPSR